MHIMLFGAVRGSGNIGDGIIEALEGMDRHPRPHLAWDNCRMTDGTYAVPDRDLSGFDAIVITVGWSDMAPFDTVRVRSVINASLALPLELAQAYVGDRHDKGGRIVFIGSYAHDHVLSNSVPYCAAKAGLQHAVRALAWDLTPLGYRVFCVNPYHVPLTPLGGETIENMVRERGISREEAKAYQAKDLRMSRHLHPMDIGKVVTWLLTDPVTDWLGGSALDLYGAVR